MIGVAPDDRGLLPDSDVQRLHELGDAIKNRYAHNLALHHLPADINSQRALDGDLDTFWSAPEGSHQATLEVHFAAPVAVSRTLTMEWLVNGQNVQRYRIEAWSNNAWTTLVTGNAIGHKKIDSFAATTTQRVRLTILSSAGTARIREFQVFSENPAAK